MDILQYKEFKQKRKIAEISLLKQNLYLFWLKEERKSIKSLPNRRTFRNTGYGRNFQKKI
jgi:hypothetical protein